MEDGGVNVTFISFETFIFEESGVFCDGKICHYLMPIRLFDFLQSGKRLRLKRIYPDAEALFKGLEREEADAIRYLALRVSGTIVRIGRQFGLLEEDMEELLGDCITLSIGHIREGRYQFVGNDPATYVIEIAKNQARASYRYKKRRQTEGLEMAGDPGEAPVAGTWADGEQLEYLLARLDEHCRSLIKLTYLEGLRDKEIVEQKLAPQTTVEALKMQRARCMRKLSALAQRAQ